MPVIKAWKCMFFFYFRLPPRRRWDLLSCELLMHRVVVNPYRCFGTTFRYHLQGDFLPLRMGPIGCQETFLGIYHNTLRKSAYRIFSFVCIRLSISSLPKFHNKFPYLHYRSCGSSLTATSVFYSLLLIMAVQTFEVGATHWLYIYTYTQPNYLASQYELCKYISRKLTHSLNM